MIERAARGWCPGPFLGGPSIGAVGSDKRANCRCGRRVAVTVRGLYAHHRHPGGISGARKAGRK